MINKYNESRIGGGSFSDLKGFTLIELLVVISIIGILAALVTFSFTSSQRQARNTQRKSDLAQFRSALETYANRNNGLYPARRTKVAITTLCGYLGIDTASCPNDPDKTENYQYCTNGLVDDAGQPSAVSYALWANLEGESNRWVVCSDGTSNKSTTLPVCGGTIDEFKCNITLPTPAP